MYSVYTQLYISIVIFIYLYIHWDHIMTTCFDRKTVINRPINNTFMVQKSEHSVGSHWVVGWRERNQQDAINLMYIIKHLSQHVSGIIMPIIRRTRVCTSAYGVLHGLWWLWLCGAGTRAVCTVKVTVRL